MGKLNRVDVGAEAVGGLVGVSGSKSGHLVVYLGNRAGSKMAGLVAKACWRETAR